MAFSNELPSVVIPPRSEGGPEYPVDYDPADELSGMAPWDPNYVPPDPPAADGTRYYPGLAPTGWRTEPVAPVADPPVGQTWADPQPYPQR